MRYPVIEVPCKLAAGEKEDLRAGRKAEDAPLSFGEYNPV